MKKFAGIALALGASIAVAPVAHADNDWISMAISDSTGQIKFSGGGSASRSAAEQVVMQECRKRVSDCRILASGQGGCLALAMNAAHSKYYGGWGPTREEAEAAASAMAGGGTVLADHDHCLGDPAS
ncbi:DUF4189 domain-containing protein [Mycobacterium sp. Marseille-P9652]|uniref:DUF4189 domain-containing protein n=1 Tax=Mycobacterium sp. Marseille-P9652 TaxID=2654950 RepID=UPI0012E898D1|nr:DUF4189 domain-containing protein [Mycobacterium sp. Marseille-P9652]